MLAFVGHSAARATLKVVTRRLDLLLLGHFRSPAEVGAYGASLRLAQVLEEISDPLYFAAFPQLARAWVEARAEFFRLLRLMAAGPRRPHGDRRRRGRGRGAPCIVSLALGPDYAPATEPFRLLLIATGVAVATLWATPGMLGSGHPAAATAAATAGALSLAALLVGLVPAWGTTGAAWARVGGAAGYLLVVLVWLARMVRQSRSSAGTCARRVAVSKQPGAAPRLAPPACSALTRGRTRHASGPPLRTPDPGIQHGGGARRQPLTERGAEEARRSAASAPSDAGSYRARITPPASMSVIAQPASTPLTGAADLDAVAARDDVHLPRPVLGEQDPGGRPEAVGAPELPEHGRRVASGIHRHQREEDASPRRIAEPPRDLGELRHDARARPAAPCSRTRGRPPVPGAG